MSKQNKKAINEEQAMFQKLNQDLKILRGLIQDQLIPINGESEQLEEVLKAISIIRRFNADCIVTLESALDDEDNF
jgi:hypothetical protein